MNSSPNPYQTPANSSATAAVSTFGPSKFVPVAIALALALAAMIGVLSTVVPTIGEFTNPRFGWIGLILCLNPLIFLLAWLAAPAKPALMAASFLMLSIGAINGVQLLVLGTVSEVSNTFTDRLHSSWFWSVIPFFVLSVYLFWHAYGMRASPQQQMPSTPEKNA
jgi:predicted transporter